MSDSDDVSQRQAQHGQKMIEVKVRFWTDAIAEEGFIRPKHAWAGGVVRMKRNESHGIAPGAPVPFNSLAELPAVIEQGLIEHGVRLHASKKMRKYLAE